MIDIETVRTAVTRTACRATERPGGHIPRFAGVPDPSNPDAVTVIIGPCSIHDPVAAVEPLPDRLCVSPCDHRRGPRAGSGITLIPSHHGNDPAAVRSRDRSAPRDR